MNPSDLKRAYYAMKVTNHHRKQKRRAIEYKGGACEVCGYSKSPAAMVFHHRNPSEKDFSISHRNLSWENLVVELDKCDLLCQNCHSEEHERLSEIGRQERIQKIRELIPERQAVIGNFKCESCGAEFRRLESECKGSRVFCSQSCSQKKQERVQWPTEECLRELVTLHPIVEIARQLGVSGNAVKKRCKKYGIQVKGQGYWQKKWAGKLT